MPSDRVLHFIHALIAACCLLPALAASALTAPDRWFARVWQTDDGLPENNVRALAQTSDRFLWLGTDSGGLTRFDGARFQKFPMLTIGTNRNTIFEKLMVDSRQRLWGGMNRGAVVCVGPESSQVYGLEHGLPDSHVLGLVEDRTGAIWVAYVNVAPITRIEGTNLTVFGSEAGVPHAPNPAWMTVDGRGELWLAKGTNLAVFQNGRFETLLGLPSPANRCIGIKEGGIWLFTLAGDLLRIGPRGEIAGSAKMPPGAGPTALLVDRSRALWIGTAAHGLFRFDGVTLEPVRTSHRDITALVEDHEGNLWVTTGGGGLNRLRPQTVALWGLDRGMPFESLTSMCKDANGALWVVTRNGVVMRETYTGWTAVSGPANGVIGHALCVTADRSGAVWIGTRNYGLYKYQKGSITNWRKGRGLLADGVRSLLVTSNGDLWVGQDYNSASANYSAALQRLRGDEWKAFNLPPATHILRSMTEDKFGNVWFGSADGQLLRVTGEELVDEADKHTNAPSAVRCLASTDDGSVWMGYAGAGIGRLKDGKFASIDSRHGLKDDRICQLIDDGLGWFWIGANSGIFKVRQQEIIDVMEGRLAQVRSIVYQRGEGMPGVQPAFETFPTGMRDHDGTLWMATRVGLAVIHPRSLSDNPDPPPVLIDRVSANGRTIAAYENLGSLPAARLSRGLDLRGTNVTFTLPPRHRRVDIDFTALSFTAPENVLFKYRLEGSDDDEWVEAGSHRTVSFPQLPAGDYRFQVIACNDSGVWHQEGATLSFAVMPFFWQTWPFRLALLTVFTLTIIAIVRYVSFRRLRRQVRLLEQQAALHRERTRIAKDIHDDLGGSLTHIALLGDLAAADMSVPDKAGGHVKKISMTARQMMKSLDEIVWAVNPRNDTLNHLIDYIGQFTFDYLRVAGIRCRLDLPEVQPECTISADVRHNLFLVIKEAVNNVVKHAKATEVWLRVSIEESRVRVIVEDNGQGFRRPPEDALADGIRNMRQRMADIGGECRIESAPGRGTRITLEVSLPKTESA